MYDFINKLRLTRQLTFEEGQISLLGKPTVMMIPADIFIELQQEYIKNNPLKLYTIGKTSGKDFHSLVSKYAIEPQQIIKFGVQVFNVSGFGRLEVVRIDYEGSRAILHLHESIFGKIKSEEPVCHYLRGFLSGFMRETLKKDLDGVESACVSQGHQLCEFVIKQKQEFDVNSPLVKKQLGF